MTKSGAIECKYLHFRRVKTMTFEQFDKVCDSIIAQCLKMRDTKGKEYARSEDRFDNFNRLAQTLGISREKVLWVYCTKHLDGITSYVNNGQTYSDERIRGRIVDAITYLMLLAGMVEENDPTITEASVPFETWSNHYHSAPGSRCSWTTLRAGVETQCDLSRGHEGDHQANDISR
jgi:hypothetical protein